MNASRFDRISKAFAHRRLSRRQAFIDGGAGLAAGTLTMATHAPVSTLAQDANPVAETDPTGEKIPYLFVQSYQSGTIAPTESAEGRYTVTLEHGTGQTIYFSDRPARDVGAGPTPQFLAGLGFPEDNPPNAALLVETAPGVTDIAVVELFEPTYDPVTRGVTYDVAVLESLEEDLELGLRETPADLATLAAEFGTAHVFIDDCADGTIRCSTNNTNYPCPDGDNCGSFGPMGFCFSWSNLACFPCEPYYHQNPTVQMVYEYWINKCNTTYPSCRDGGRQSYGCYPRLPGVIG